MATSISDETLAIRGGKPCVVDRPASYAHGPQEMGEEEIEAVTAAIRSGNLFRFGRAADQSPTAQFEALFSEKTRVAHALAVNSGTSALICGMVGLGLSSGDEVIVPAYTYIATASAALAVRAIPVVAEIDDSLTLDPEDVERKITPRTKLIVPVHMRGTPSRMEELLDVGRKHGIPILEDCAQANGGSYRGTPLGSVGDAGAFSLQQFKIITAGEGGAFVSNDKHVFDRGACYHDSAYAFWKERTNELSIPPFAGENYRMSELNGAVALAQLRKRDGILSRLRAIKARLLDGIADLPGIRMQDVPDPDGDCAVSAAFFVQSSDRAKAFAEALRAEGMSAGCFIDKSIPDRHVYCYWDYVLEQRTSDTHGYPWRDPSRPAQVNYHKDMCPKSLDWLSRCVVIPLTQVMSQAHVDSCVTAIRRTATTL